MQTSLRRRQFLASAAAAAMGASLLSHAGAQTTTDAGANRTQNTFSISMNSFSYGRFDLAQCLEQIKSTPIRQLEAPAEQMRPNSLVPELMVDAPLDGRWQYSFPDLQALLARDGFRVESVDVFGYTAYPGAERFIKQRIDFAQRLGARTLVLGCNHRALSHAPAGGQESPEQKAARTFIYAMLRELAEYGAPRNVRIALEIHGGVTANAQESLRTIKEVGHANLGINFDVANILIYNPSFGAQEAAQDLKALAKHVFHVHLKDVVRSKTDSHFTMPCLGKGEVDFRRVFDILHEAGFYGPFSFEVETFHGVTTSNDIRDYLNDVVASINYLKSLGEFTL